MRKAYAVIGGAYGDEGKGLAVDGLTARALASGEKVCVVRSNGGAQAGHTVCTPQGRRHVFSHVGAGTLAGADTHLSRFFVVHPMIFRAEMGHLRDLGGSFGVSIDPRAPVTTPWEMFINQIVEQARGNARHGSCGLGFGETLERQEKGPSVTYADLNKPDIEERLRTVREEWLPNRLDALGVARVPDSFIDIIASQGLQDAFLQDLRFLQQMSVGREDATALQEAETVIFEGAQGLCLSADSKDFPHVTRSDTGLRNPVALMSEQDCSVLDVFYMTRSYTTRHGAGPLPDERLVVQGVEVRDPTNRPNAWQGGLRLAPLQTSRLRADISRDLQEARSGIAQVNAALGVTHLDALGTSVEMERNAQVGGVDRADVLEAISDAIGLSVVLSSFGPTRSTLVWNE